MVCVWREGRATAATLDTHTLPPSPLPGGPAGGDGGDGGNVYAVADPSLTSLGVFRRSIHFRGLPGTPGGGSKRAGANAHHVEVRVPPGTIFRERGAAPGARPLAEVVADGTRVLLAAGGRGGRGNAAFKTHKNNAPTLAELGEPGEEKWLDVELRIVADVALVGAPNAGKSTLLSALSAAKPKVASYPFTTLVPNLGVCELDFRATVFADIPGLVAGASTGIGLGHEFLRHVSRCRAVVHVVDGSSPDPVADYRTVRAELAAFSPRLAALPCVVAYNKVDLPDSADYVSDVAAELVTLANAAEEKAAADAAVDDDGEASPLPHHLTAANVIPISGATGSGVVDLVRRVRVILDALPPVDGVALQTDALNMTAPVRAPAVVRDFEVDMEGSTRVWTVSGPGIDRFVSQTDWNYYESALRFQRVLEVSGRRRERERLVEGRSVEVWTGLTPLFQNQTPPPGIASTLRNRGVREGDTVRVGGAEFAWSDDRSDGALYDVWMTARKDAGRVLQGGARWPHAGG